MPHPKKGETALDRFMDAIRVGDGCWEWQKGLTSGYGRFRDEASNLVIASRYAYTLLVGEVPDGLFVLHRCDNRLCVRPDHLFLGTRQDNNADRDAKGRNVVLRGEVHGSAKLTDAQVREMRRLFLGGKGLDELSTRFAVSRSNIVAIVRRITWKHVD